jgi:IS605 OrfB family transposase
VNKLLKTKKSKQQTTQSSINKVPKQSFVLRTESIRLPKGETKHLTSKCNVSRIIYNSANYHFRTRYHKTGKGPTRSLVWSWLKNQIDFPLWKKSIGAKTCDQILFVLISAYRGYFEALKEWKIDPSKFLAKPQVPSYINRVIGGNRLFILPLAGESLRVDNETGIIRTPKTIGLKVQSFLSRGKEVRFARIVPKSNKRFVFDIIYRIETVPFSKKNSRIATIDTGVKNMVTLSTNFGSEPFKISGGPALSINQYFHKEKARLNAIYTKTNAKSFSKRDELTEKRNKKLFDFIHKSSRSVINYCVDHQVDTIVIGKNEYWKQNMKMGKRNNQNFASIPIGRLIDQITYKAADHGIQVIANEENYTSKCSFLDNEFPQHYSSYLGKRVNRGLFRANDGTYEVN